MLHVRTCDFCTATYTAVREHSRFCSTAHRTAYARVRREFGTLRLEETRATLARQLAVALSSPVDVERADADLAHVQQRTDNLLGKLPSQ